MRKSQFKSKSLSWFISFLCISMLYLFSETQENSTNFLCSIALFFIHCNSDVENILFSLHFAKIQSFSLALWIWSLGDKQGLCWGQWTRYCLPTMVFCWNFYEAWLGLHFPSKTFYLYLFHLTWAANLWIAFSRSSMYLDPVENSLVGFWSSVWYCLANCWCWLLCLAGLVLAKHFASQTQAVKIFLRRAGEEISRVFSTALADRARGVTINSLSLMELSLGENEDWGNIPCDKALHSARSSRNADVCMFVCLFVQST